MVSAAVSLVRLHGGKRMICRDIRNTPGNRFQRSLLGAVSVNNRKTAWPIIQTKLREVLRVDCHSSSWMLPPLLLGKTRCLP